MGRALTPGLMAGAVAEVSPTQLAQEEDVPGWHHQTTVLSALGIIVLLLVIAGLLCWWRPPRRGRWAALPSEQQVGSPSCPRSASSLLLWLFLAFGMPGRGEGWRSFPDHLGQDGEAVAAIIWETREAPPGPFYHTRHAKLSGREIDCGKADEPRLCRCSRAHLARRQQRRTDAALSTVSGILLSHPLPHRLRPLISHWSWPGAVSHQRSCPPLEAHGLAAPGWRKRSEGHSGPGGWSEFQGGRTGNFKNSRCAFFPCSLPPAPAPYTIVPKASVHWS